jgi:hypothetical protein
MMPAENEEENIGSLWKLSINVEGQQMLLTSLVCCDGPPGVCLIQNHGVWFLHY